jgi:hypothetical protein
MASFADILNRPVSEVKAPPPFPVGSYLAVVDGQGEWGESRNARTKQIQFKAKLLQPQEDVDTEKLMEWKDATGDNVIGQQVYLTFYDPQPWRLADFLKHLGLEDMPVMEAIANAPGRQFLVTLRHRPSMDGQMIQHEVASTAAI